MAKTLPLFSQLCISVRYGETSTARGTGLPPSRCCSRGAGACRALGLGVHNLLLEQWIQGETFELQLLGGSGDVHFFCPYQLVWQEMLLPQGGLYHAAAQSRPSSPGTHRPKDPPLSRLRAFSS